MDKVGMIAGALLASRRKTKTENCPGCGIEYTARLIATACRKCVRRRNNKKQALRKKVKVDVKKQTNTIIELINDSNGIYRISITDRVCALDFQKYADQDASLLENDVVGNVDFILAFEDAENVVVDLADFVKYHQMYSKSAIDLAEKYADIIDELRDLQASEFDKLVNQHAEIQYFARELE